jgi:hypothetical protein
MRFTLAWSTVLSQNITLRWALGMVSVCALTFAVICTKLALREPILIERACTSQIVKPASLTQSVLEVETFIRLALLKRFETEATGSEDFLSTDEAGFKEEEQTLLKAKGFSQNLLIKTIKVESGTVSVDAYRILVNAGVPSAQRMQLQVELSSIARTAQNPYGLILKRVSLRKSIESEKK